MKQKSANIDLIVVRHGKAAHNLGSEKEHTFAGSKIDNELTEYGILNAKFLANEIKNQGGADAIICSDLNRSRQTAEIIQKENDNIPIYEINELQEINIGDFAGHTEDEVKSLFLTSAESFYNGDIEKWQFPNGENFGSVSKRLDIVLKKIQDISLHIDKIVISGHGMINRVLFYKLIPERKDLWQERSYPHDRIVEIELKRED